MRNCEKRRQPSAAVRRLYADLGRCQRICEDHAERGNDALCEGAGKEQDLRGGEGISENGNDLLTHHARERRACHHTEEGGEVGDDGVEREVIGSVLVGQIDVRQRGHDRARRNAENVLGESHHDVEPYGVRRDEGIRVIGRSMDQKHDRKGTEPIMLGDELLPHTRKEDKEQKVRRIDAVAERVADADVIKDVCVERRVGQVEREGIGSCDQNRAQKTLVFHGKRENIGEFRLCRGRVGEFLWHEPNDTVHDGKRECDKTDGDQHGELLGRTRKRVADRGHDERDGEGDGGVDAARGVEIVHAHVIGQEVGVPCRKAGGKKLVNGVGNDDQHDEPNEQRGLILDDHRKNRDADNADRVIRELARREDPFSPLEMLQQNR